MVLQVCHFQHFPQTGSHNVQTHHNYNVPSGFGVGQNGSANVFQLQNVSQSGSHSVQTHQNVPSLYSVGQNGPASVSQTGSQSVQTARNMPSVFSVGQNGPANVFQIQNVSQCGSQSVQPPQNVPSVHSMGQNGPASVSQTGSQSVQAPHNLHYMYGVGQNYITSAAQPQSVFQPQLPQTVSHNVPSMFGVGQYMYHMQQVQHDQHGSDPISSLIASLENLSTSQDIYASQMANTRQRLWYLGLANKDLGSSLQGEFVDLNVFLPPLLASNSMPLTGIEPSIS